MESRQITGTIITLFYSKEHFDFCMLRTQVQLAEMVIKHGKLPGLSAAKIRKLRKADLAAVMAHHLDEYQAAVDYGYTEKIKNAQRLKPAGMRRSLYPKQKRQRLTRDHGGMSRKARRELTKNKHRKTRGFMRLLRSQAA